MWQQAGLQPDTDVSRAVDGLVTEASGALGIVAPRPAVNFVYNYYPRAYVQLQLDANYSEHAVQRLACLPACPRMPACAACLH